MAGRQVIVSGTRPTGRLHLGNWHGALKNWVRLQHEHECFFFVADWHALTTAWEDPIGIEESTVEMVLDWLAVGLDPARCTIFQQSAVKEHAELFLLLGMVTPVPWLERNPTYKEQRELLVERDLSTLGGYSCPAGGRRPHLQRRRPCRSGWTRRRTSTGARDRARRSTRPTTRSFRSRRRCSPRRRNILGTDGRKMSKSYGNAIYLTEPPEDVDRKLSRMVTDPRRARRTDPGEPADCPAYLSFHRTYCTPEELRWQEEGCRAASIGCLECKKVTIAHVLAELEPFRARRAGLTADDARSVLAAGNARARQVAAETMAEVRAAVGLA